MDRNEKEASGKNLYCGHAPVRICCALLGSILVAPVTVFCLLPFYRRLNVTTIYEYLSSLYNIEREEFLSSYLPEGITVEECIRENILHAPFSVRDKASRYLAIAIVEEIKAGCATDSGGIYVDLTDCPSFRGTRQDHFFRYRGIAASRAIDEESQIL